MHNGNQSHETPPALAHGLNGTEPASAKLAKVWRQLEQVQDLEKQISCLLTAVEEKAQKREAEVTGALGSLNEAISAMRTSRESAVGGPVAAQLAYDAMIRQIRATAEAVLPLGTTALVVSKG